MVQRKTQRTVFGEPNSNGSKTFMETYWPQKLATEMAFHEKLNAKHKVDVSKIATDLAADGDVNREMVTESDGEVGSSVAQGDAGSDHSTNTVADQLNKLETLVGVNILYLHHCRNIIFIIATVISE